MKILWQSMAVALLLIQASLFADAPAKPTITEISDVPWSPTALPPSGGVTPKVIYGADDRIDLYQETNLERQVWAQSVCGLMQSSRLSNNGDGTFTLNTSAYVQLGRPACESEPFRSQPSAAFCTGFVVGEDLIATAGHCYASTNLSTTRFVFGFAMNGPSDPVLQVSADQVYTGVSIVARRLLGDEDYTIVRVDRPITAPGARPLPIRREGVIPNGTQIGVIGHPAGLPLKLAFGSETRVRSNTPAAYFVANLDTYGGNSGSPVFNAATGVVEGILVRGETDYVINGSCFVSNQVSDAGGRGEDVTKTTLFAEFVPEIVGSAGVVRLDRERYGCSGVITIDLSDMDLDGQSSATVMLSSTLGDQETVTLGAVSGGQFTGQIAIGVGSAVPGNGVLEVASGAGIEVRYQDADAGDGLPATVTETALVDCDAPTISNVQVVFVSTSQASIAFDTNEETVASVLVGSDCAALSQQSSSSGAALSHLVLLSGLTPDTSYRFAVQVEDLAGNERFDNNGGLCYTFETAFQQDFVFQAFISGAQNLTGTSIQIVPQGNGYTSCRLPIAELPFAPEDGASLELSDDGSVLIELPPGRSFPFFGIDYTRFYVNANGNITFNTPDSTYNQSISIHYDQPRISPLFVDLNPEAGGAVTLSVLDDGVVLSWDGICVFNQTGLNRLQAVLYDNGSMMLNYELVSAANGLVGLSAGLGVPTDLVFNDFPNALECGGEIGDMDGDGLPDAWEIRAGLDPTDATGDNGADGDPDNDGLSNAEEFDLGTHPLRADSDRDGVDDGDEVLNGTDPSGRTKPHDADRFGTWEIGLRDLLRVIQMFNSPGYWCGEGTEDGYAVEPGGGRACRLHHSDYQGQEWHINLSEVLRMIQLFNADGYTRNVFSEDTFEPIFLEKLGPAG